MCCCSTPRQGRTKSSIVFSVGSHLALAVLERPCRRLGPRRPSARPLTLVVSQIRGIVVVRALHHTRAEKAGDRSYATRRAVADDQPLRVDSPDTLDRGARHTGIFLRAPDLHLLINGFLGLALPPLRQLRPLL